MDYVSDRDRKNFRQQRRSQSGQALIEYVLILIVVVTIILGGMYQLSSAFQFWANNYFGDYLSCLLETGELPTLGSSQGTGECAQAYKEFSIANGRPMVGDPIGEAGAGSGDEGQFGKDENETENESSASAETGPISVASSRSSGRSTRFRASRNSSSRGSESGGISRETSGGGGSGGGYTSDSRRGGNRIAVTGRTGFERGKANKDKENKVTKAKVAVEQGETQKSGPKLIPIQRQLASEVVAPDIEAFTFGNFLRYIVIAVILIALLLFFGGQLLQVSKSMD